MKDLVEGVIRLLEQKESFALATIVKQRGSAPRDSGAHMAIRADGGILGTIGGGLLEALVQQHAVHVLQEHKMHVLELNLTCRQAAQMDMICGGQVEVLIDFIDVQEAGYLDIYRGILSSSKSGQRAWLVTSLSPNESVCRTRQCLVKNSSEIIGWEGCPSGDLESLLPQMPNIRSFTVFDDLQLMIEPLGCSGTTYVFGGGHIAHKLVPLLNMVEFATVVVDDRVEYANIERFTTADQIIVSDFTSVFNELDIDEQ
ncbi:MAG TPA: XdhC family protein, partial [Syntrophomonadaceae bacterium]|nr:XdhC family protein [Syntrophomonadaceae bacterium]